MVLLLKNIVKNYQLTFLIVFYDIFIFKLTSIKVFLLKIALFKKLSFYFGFFFKSNAFKKLPITHIDRDL
jgi:hypothetical protein